MEISKKHGSILLTSFFIFPYLTSRTLVALGIPDFGFIDGWKDFYEIALGTSNNYSSLASLYLILSPLSALWAHSRVRMQEVSIWRALLLPIGGILISLLLFYVALNGPPLAAIEAPTKGMSKIIAIGRYHIGFSIMFSGLVMSAVVSAYVSLYVLLNVVNLFIRR